MNIIITGSNGFIGSRLLEILSNYKKYKILNLVRSKPSKFYNKNIKFLRCNLNRLNNQASQIIKFKPDALIHLAWDNIPNFSYKNSKKNKNTSINLIKFFEMNTKIKNIIISGSCFELYPPNNSYKYFKDAKNKILDFVKLRSKNKKFIFQWLRIFYVFGPKQRKQALIPHLISAISNRKKLVLNAPDFKHDFIYVDDVCSCIIKCLNKNIGSNIFEVGNGKTIKVKKILEIIEQLKSKKITLDYSEKKTNQNFKARITKLKRKLNWKPNTSIINGIKKVIKLSKI